jgi:hypothetical protein
MKTPRAVWPAVALAAVLAGPALAAPLSSSDRQWIAACVNHNQFEPRTPEAVQRYCTCMQKIVPSDQALTQSDMERAFPPAHLACRKAAGLQ